MASTRGLSIRRGVALLVAGALACGVAACGGDDSADAGSGPTKLGVAAFPIANVIPLYYAKQNGIFKKHGLDVEITLVGTSADTIAAAVSGDSPIAYTGLTSFIGAVAEGLPLKAVTNATHYTTGTSGVVASPKSGIKKVPDMNGKTIAVTGIKSQTDLFLRAAGDALGADSKTFKVIAVPFPEQQAALDAGQVDAAWMVVPFYPGALKKGGVSVLEEPIKPVFGSIKNVSQDVYAATDKFIADNPETVDAFRAAIDEATEYVQKHPDVIPPTLAGYTEFSEEDAADLPMPIFSSYLDLTVNQKWADTMLKYKFVPEPVKLSEHVALGDG